MIISRLETGALMDIDNRSAEGGNMLHNLRLGNALLAIPSQDHRDAIVQVKSSCPVAEVNAMDLIRIDFGINQIRYDGLYLITLDDNWIGFRRFQFTPTLQMRDSVSSYPVTPEIMKSIKVIGLVKDVYQSSNGRSKHA